jgi:hypothetical protein
MKIRFRVLCQGEGAGGLRSAGIPVLTVFNDNQWFVILILYFILYKIRMFYFCSIMMEEKYIFVIL